MERLTSEPSLNPPEDSKWDMISDSVSDMDELQLAQELIDRGMEERTYEIIVNHHLKYLSFMKTHPVKKIIEDLLYVTEFKQLIVNCIDRMIILEIKEMLADTMYHEDE